MKLTKATFYGKIQDGKLKLDNRKLMEEHIFMFPEGAEMQLSIERKRKNRSLLENNYYWGVVIPTLCDYFGYEPEEMHEALKWQFLRKEEKDIPTVGSTASLSTVEFEDLMACIRAWALDQFNILIPQPNEDIQATYSNQHYK